jgi:pimeloyl-ACP methyl ester carboxylesterase
LLKSIDALSSSCSARRLQRKNPERVMESILKFLARFEGLSSPERNTSTVTHHRAEVNGIRLYYRKAGGGEPVVLLHGFPETSYAWRKIMPELAEYFTVIAPDLRGCGDSDRPSEGYDKQTVAEDVHQLVRQLKLDSINLVGHDVGMMVAYATLPLIQRKCGGSFSWRRLCLD